MTTSEKKSQDFSAKIYFYIYNYIARPPVNNLNDSIYIWLQCF